MSERMDLPYLVFGYENPRGQFWRPIIIPGVRPEWK
jgi:hypothetical protein